MKFVVILCVIAICGIKGDPQGPDRNQLTEMFHWDFLNFDFPPNRREQAIASASYIPSKNGIMAGAVWRDKMFVSVFRLSTGVLSSLNYFFLNTTEKSPVLHPYPSFDANYVNEDPNNKTVSLPSPSSIITVCHFHIDKCNRLWIPDSGYSDHYGNRRQIAPPALVIFDLTTDTLLRRIEIPHLYINPHTALADIDVDFDGDECDDAHAYVTDMFRSIIVYSFKKDRVWQVVHNFMGSDPHEGNFVYASFNYQWNFGVYAIVVGDKQADGSKRVYFAPLASTKTYYVSNQVLKDENYTLSKYYNDVHLLGDSGKGWHACRLAYDENTGSMFNTAFLRSTIGCWNVHLPFQSVSTLHKTSSEFFPCGLHIDNNRNLWVMSHLVPHIAYDHLPQGGRNVRVFKETVDRAIVGTNCKAHKS